MYYFIIWLIIASSATLYFLYQNKTVWRWACTICYIALVFTAGLRYETGTDYFSYLEIYNKVPPLTHFFPVINDMEVGYIFLNSLFQTMGVAINVMFLFISAITTFILFRSFQTYIPRPFFFVSLLLYYSTIYIGLDMSGVRQAIAVAIFLFSLRYVFRSQFWKYSLCIIIACLFHQSALLLWAFYPVLKMRFRLSVIIPVLGIGILIFIFKIAWLHTLLEYGASLFSEDTLIGQKLIAYSSSEIFLRNRPFSPAIPFYMTLFILLILAFIKRLRLSEQTPYFTIIFNLFFLFILSFFYLYESLDISFRFGYYFMLSYVFLFPLALGLLKSRKQHLIVAMTAIFMLSAYTMREVFLEGNKQMRMYRPYQNYVWIKMGLQHSDTEKHKLKSEPPDEDMN
ncbi:MAG: EpsG family protein [Prevotellaceae bacterium]|nr:EpsG family protein [Prevotellaceae bacterium]